MSLQSATLHFIASGYKQIDDVSGAAGEKSFMHADEMGRKIFSKTRSPV
jgi:hypothetical protein